MADIRRQGPLRGHRRQARLPQVLRRPETGCIAVGAGLPAMRPVLTTGRWHGVRHGAKAVMRDWQLPPASGPSPSPVIHLKQRRDNKRPLLFQILSHTTGIGGFKLNLEVLISLPK